MKQAKARTSEKECIVYEEVLIKWEEDSFCRWILFSLLVDGVRSASIMCNRYAKHLILII